MGYAAGWAATDWACAHGTAIENAQAAVITNTKIRVDSIVAMGF
jgi:hypothetical protein